MKYDRKKGKGSLAALGAAAVLACSMCACSLIPEEEEFRQAPTVSDYEAIEYVTSPCTRTDVETTVTISVNYVPIQTAKLTFGIAGKAYEEVYVAVGDTVHEGDILAELDMGDLDTRIAEVGLTIEKYELSLAQNEESRLVALRKAELQSQNLSEEDRAEAIAAVNKTYDAKKQSIGDLKYIAELRLQDYEDQKAARQIIAPFDGTVTYTYGFAADDVSDITKEVVRVADSSMSLFTGKSDSWDSFHSGDEAVIVTSDNSYEAYFATEEELGIAKTDHVVGKRGQVYLVLKETAYDLKDSASGKVTVVLESSRGCLSVPVRAVSEINGSPVVYIPDENGMKTYRSVEIGLVGSSRVEILSGLEEGERVVVN